MVSEISPTLKSDQSSPEAVRGTVFNIQKYSIHDGPGIRTVVFLKGCPLACAWCSNPESQKARLEVGHGDALCSQCGKCLAICPNQAITLATPKGIKIDRKLCAGCGKCVSVCLTGALKMFGQEMTAEAVYQAVEKDAEFYRESGGGVTVSGGEPLMQSQFVSALFQLCQMGGIRTAVETTGCVSPQAIQEVLPLTDLFLFDVKQADSQTHFQWTKQPNEAILANLQTVAKSGKEVIVRVPLIPGVNNSREALGAIGKMVLQTLNPPRMDLLPYHRYGTGKYEMLDRVYPLAEVGKLEEGEAQGYRDYLIGLGIQAKVVE